MDFLLSSLPFSDYPLITKSLLELIIRFGIDFVLIYFIVMVIYRPSKGADVAYQFTFFTLNILIFFICYFMASTELELGMAFGLFALFSIFRYRTGSLAIKEMTYLFAVVCIGVINALSKMSLVEWLFADVMLLVTIFALERYFFRNMDYLDLQNSKLIYDRLDLVAPEKREELIADIRERTGLDVEKVTVGTIDVRNETVNLQVYYKT